MAESCATWCCAACCMSGGAAGDVDSLFQSVGHVSRAVGTLVNIMTDDETADNPTLLTAPVHAGPVCTSRQ